MAVCSTCAGSGEEQCGVEVEYDSWGRSRVRILHRRCTTCGGKGRVPDP